MLEIVIVWLLSKKVAAIARGKRRSAAGYVILLVVMWLGGEITGGITGAIVGTITAGPGGEPEMLLVYGGALAGAAVGAITTFVIVNSLSDVRDEYALRKPDYDDREWRDRQYKKSFGAADPKSGDFTKDPYERPQGESDRYKAE